MDWSKEKCVMILDENLPLGLIANTAAIMGITLGKHLPEVVGEDVLDRSGNVHLGIIEFPVPVLKSSPEAIKAVPGADRGGLLRPGPGVQDLRRVYRKNGTGPGGGAAIFWHSHLRHEEKDKSAHRQYAAAAMIWKRRFAPLPL